MRWGWRKQICQSSGRQQERACKARGGSCVYWRSGSHSAHWLTSWVRSLPWGLGVSLQPLSLIICFGSFSPSTLRLSLNPRASAVGDRVCPPWPESPRPLWSLPSDLQRPERASGGRGGGERSQGVLPLSQQALVLAVLCSFPKGTAPVPLAPFPGQQH